MKIFQKVQGNLATNLYVTSNNKTAFAKKADSEDHFEQEYPLPAWNDLWVDKNGQLWLAVGENVRCMRDSNGKWCDPTAIIPIDSDEVKNAGPFVRVEDDDIADADHEEARPDRDGIWVDSNEIYWQVYGDKATMFCDPEHTDWTTGDAGFRLDRNHEPVDKILAYGPFTYIRMSETKTASVKKADSAFDSDLELPDSDGLWLDKYNGLWEVCADEAMMIHDSSSAWGLDDDMEVVPLEQLGEFAPFRRTELKAVGRKANASAFASKPVASVDVTLTRMNVKTGSERLLKSFKTSSADEALRLAEKQFGKMTEVKTADETKTASRTFKTARRKLSMQEKLRLIDEDRLEDDDFDL